MSVFSKLKQFKDMRESAKKAQNILGAESVEGQGAWGKVKVKMTGTFEVTGVTIDESLAGKKADLESAVKDAIADAVKKVQMVLFRKRKELEGIQK
jgi:DNA-binding protein YbaB